ncbi:HEAT repeat domain-containing protein [Acidobacteria bacterium AH-259-O06]|nr:HEAT repeat domain-containing protein [Acidobacteria bacterium AH-259-O06]
MKIEKVPVKRILEELARQADLKVSLEGSVGNEEVSVEFTHLPLEEGIRRILIGKSYALVYARTPSLSGHGALPKLVKILVVQEAGPSMPKATEDLAIVPPGGATGGGPRPLAELMREAVEDPDPYQRVAALEALGEWGEEEEILPTIVTAALRDEDPFAHEVALEMLQARLETVDELVKPVAQVVLTATSPQAGMAAFDLMLELVGEIDEEGGWGPLGQALQDLDPGVSDLGQGLLEEP